jgi:hypothetical protein
MRVSEVEDEDERARLWKLAIAAYPPYAKYQVRTAWRIPVFVARAVLTKGLGLLFACWPVCNVNLLTVSLRCPVKPRRSSAFGGAQTKLNRYR